MIGRIPSHRKICLSTRSENIQGRAVCLSVRVTEITERI
jgi:hypothetical protein